MIEFEDSISPEGRARGQTILRLAKDAARSRRRRRKIAPLASAALILIVASVGYRMRPAPTPPIVKSFVAPSPVATPIERLQTDPTIADRLSITSRPEW